MNKIQYLDPIALIFTPIYFFIVVLIIGSLIMRMFKSNFKTFSFVGVIIYYYFIFLSNYTMDFMPFYPDIKLFTQMMVNNTEPMNQSTGVRQYFLLMQPLYFISFYKLELFMILVISISVLSYAILWHSFEIFNSFNKTNLTNKVFKYFILLLCIYPGSLLFITIPLREWLTLFGFSLLFYSLVLLLTNSRNGWIYFTFSFIVIVIPRPLMAIIPIIGLSLIFGSLRTKFILATVMVIIIPFIFEIFTSYTFNPEFFSLLRNNANQNYEDSGMVYGPVSWVSFFDIIIDLPFLFLQLLLSPLPILHDVNPFTMKAHLIDSIFVILILLLSLLNSKKYFFYLIFFILFSLIFSIWEFYIGGAVRHRLPLIAILLPIAALSLSKFKFRFER